MIHPEKQHGSSGVLKELVYQDSEPEDHTDAVVKYLQVKTIFLDTIS